MKLVTISTRVSQDVVQKVAESGFQISDTLLAGLEIFLTLPEDKKQSLILRQLAIKKKNRARNRFG